MAFKQSVGDLLLLTESKVGQAAFTLYIGTCYAVNRVHCSLNFNGSKPPKTTNLWVGRGQVYHNLNPDHKNLFS